MASRPLPGGQIPIPPPPPAPSGAIPRPATTGLPAGVTPVVPRPTTYPQQQQARPLPNMNYGNQPMRPPPVEISDLRQDVPSEGAIAEELASYKVFRFVKNIPDYAYDPDDEDVNHSFWENCQVTERSDNKKDVVREIKRLHKDKKPVAVMMKALNVAQQRQLERKLQYLIAAERDTRFEWNIVQIDEDLKLWAPRPVDSQGRPREDKMKRNNGGVAKTYKHNGKTLKERVAITGFYRRAPREGQIPSQIRYQIQVERARYEQQVRDQQRHQQEMEVKQRQMEALQRQKAFQQQLENQRQAQARLPKPQPIKVIKPKRDRRHHRRESHSSESSYSGISSDSEYDSEYTSPTTLSSGSFHRRRPKDRARRESRRYIEDPRDYGRLPSTRRHSIAGGNGYDTPGRGGRRVPLVPMAPGGATQQEAMQAIRDGAYQKGRADEANLIMEHQARIEAETERERERERERMRYQPRLMPRPEIHQRPWQRYSDDGTSSLADEMAALQVREQAREQARRIVDGRRRRDAAAAAVEEELYRREEAERRREEAERRREDEWARDRGRRWREDTSYHF